MALTENYRALYADLTDSELAEVGAFVSDLILAKSSSDSEKIASLLQSALSDLTQDEDSLDLFFGTAEYVENCGDAGDKIAVANLLDCVGSLIGSPTKTASFATAAQLGLSAAGVGLAAAPFIAHATRRRAQEGKIKKSFAEVMRDHPHLRGDPHLSRYFQAIVDFAPNVAANSLVAGNVLNSMHQIGPQAVTPEAIGKLLSVEKDYVGQPQGADLLSETAKPVSDFGHTIGHLYGKNPKK